MKKIKLWIFIEIKRTVAKAAVGIYENVCVILSVKVVLLLPKNSGSYYRKCTIVKLIAHYVAN